MASRIPTDELSTLKSASEVKTVAEAMPMEMEKSAVATLINQAANCGEFKVTYNNALSEELQTELETQGYKIKYNDDDAIYRRQCIISWR